MSLRRSVAAAVAVATVSLLASAAAAGPWNLKPGEFYSEMSGSFVSTSSFFNDDQDRVPMGGRLEQRVVRSHNEFGWKKRLNWVVDVPFVSRTFAADAGGSATSTGLGDLGLALRYGMHAGSMPVALTVGWTAPLGGNARIFPATSGEGGLNGGSLVSQYTKQLSDSSTFFSGGLQSLSVGLDLGAPLGKGAYWTLGGAYTTRYLTIAARDVSDRYADFYSGDFALGFWLGKNLLVTGAAHGEWASSQSASYDRIAAGPDLESTGMIAGARFTYRVDERMDVFAGSWHTPSGQNVLHADQYYCGIAWKQTGLDRLAGALGGTKAH